MTSISIVELCSVVGMLVVLFSVALKLQANITEKLSMVDYRESMNEIQKGWKEELGYVRDSLHELRNTAHQISVELATIKAVRLRDDQLREILKEAKVIS